MPAAASRTALGAACWTATEKVNAELFALTHGAFVRQILRDHEDDVECANAALERVGRAMGASGASARANIACRSDEVTSVRRWVEKSNSKCYAS